jgi:hypothetical protein
MDMDCSSGGCGSDCHAPPCPCPTGGNPEIDSADKVLSCYVNSQHALNVEKNYYENVDSLSAVLSDAAQALDDENEAYDPRAPHVVPPKAIKQAEKNLLACEDKIAACADFAALSVIVKDAIGELDGLDPTLLYATTLRIAMYLQKMPVNVQLPPPAFEGLNAIVPVEDGVTEVSKEVLPSGLQQFPSEEITQFLTTCGNQLCWLREAGKF